MTGDQSVLVHRSGRLARVTLHRPSRRNSFDLRMLARLEDVLHELGRDRTVEVVVLTGDGTVFCAGTDLHELAGLDAETTMYVQRRTAELVERWYRLEQTTVAAFNGPAIGSGAVLGLASDLRVAADSAYFTFPEVTFGIPLTWSGMAILADLVGADLAKRWLLLGERVEPADMLALRLVTAVVDVDGLPAAVTGITTGCSPLRRSAGR